MSAPPADGRMSGAAVPIGIAGARSSPHLLMPMTLLFVLLVIAVLRSPVLVTNSGLGSAVIVAAPLILATYALMSTVVAGRGTVDLAIGPLISFINVTLIQLVAADVLGSPIVVFVYAVAVGMAYQLLMALIVIFVRVQPIIVSLSGFLALSGINLVILPRPGGVAPDWMASWGAGTSVFSPVMAILVLASLAWLLMTRTTFFTHLRLMGSDERAAYTSGIPITIVRIGAHLMSGFFAGLSAICFTALIGSGDPGQGTTYTLLAVTALVLGGASLGGGRASLSGSLIGAVDLYLITYVLSTFSFGGIQSFVTDLCYGAILVASLLLTLTLPLIQRTIGGFSSLLYFVALAIVALGVILYSTWSGDTPGTAAGPAATGFLEIEALRGAGAEAGHDGRIWAFVGVLLLTLPLLARTLIVGTPRRGLGPIVYIVVIGVALLVVYLATHGLAGGAQHGSARP